MARNKYKKIIEKLITGTSFIKEKPGKFLNKNLYLSLIFLNIQHKLMYI